MNTRSITVTQLRRHLRETLHAVQESRSITITRHGRAVALLIRPVEDQPHAWPVGYFDQTYGALADFELQDDDQS